MSNITAHMHGGSQGTDNFYEAARQPNGQELFTARSKSDSSQTQGNTPTDVTDLTMWLKPNCAFSFSYDIIYSTTGVLVGCQFAVDMTGALVSIGYGITLTMINSALISDATTTRNTFLGSGASLVGGGPKTARLFGSIVTGNFSLGQGDLRLRFQATGVLGVTATVLPNSCGKAEEQ